MSEVLDKHTADSKSIGFDYQFYYFLYLLLDLRLGEKIGYEIKDDIHIDKADGTTILIQAKHTIQTNATGEKINMSTLDIDMWKTLGVWADYVDTIDEKDIEKLHFVLAANKSIPKNNVFVNSIIKFQEKDNGYSLKDVIADLNNLESKNDDVKENIDKIIKLPETKQILFFEHFEIENIDDLIQKSQKRIQERIFLNDFKRAETIFENLVGNVMNDKYIVIDTKGKFELSYDGFTSRYHKCFEIAFKDRPLPKRNFSITIPKNTEDQMFIRQLIDIGDVVSGSSDILEYTTIMLQTLNQIQYWIENGLVLSTELDDLRKNAISKWKNEFKLKYNTIKTKLSNGSTMNELESDIRQLACELLGYIRRIDLSLCNQNLDTELSNGYYYRLSNNLQIGWHYDWENKYKKI